MVAVATSIRLEDTVKARLQRLAESRERSPHWLMNRAIEEYVEREEAVERLRDEGRASWQAFRESGEHLTGAETRRWLKSWGTEAETPAPECHK